MASIELDVPWLTDNLARRRGESTTPGQRRPRPSGATRLAAQMANATTSSTTA